jgi:hypothetical protein
MDDEFTDSSGGVLTNDWAAPGATETDASRMSTTHSYAEVFIAQHREPEARVGRSLTDRHLGYFASLEEAQHALDQRYEPGCWQGIRRDATGERWWRNDRTIAWVGPVRKIHVV